MMQTAFLIHAAAGAAHHAPVAGPIVLELALLGLLLAIGLAIIVQRSLFVVVMFAGAYSLVSAAFFVALDAVDVAFTEAAVGAGISTVLMLGAMLLTAREARKAAPGRRWGPLIAVLGTGAVLLYATKDMPAFGDAESPANAYVGRTYLVRTPLEIGAPNVVTAVLASYRGYDTLGETVVIFTAGLGVMLLLGLRDPGEGRRNRAPVERGAERRSARKEDRAGEGEGDA
jgi:multicomponent Na+:H+ antiporter subunit B